MDNHLRVQFDHFLAGACESFSQRVFQRAGGLLEAIALLRSDAGAGVTAEFVTALLSESCLDTADGALWLLGCLPQRTVTVTGATSTVSDHVQALAAQVVAELIHSKVVEQMDRESAYL